MSSFVSNRAVRREPPSARDSLPPVSPDALRSLTAHAETWSDWLTRAGLLTQEVLQSPGVFVWEPAGQQTAERLSGLCFPAEGLTEDRRQTLRQLGERALSAAGVVFGAFGSETELVAAIKLPKPKSNCVLLLPLNPQAPSRAVIGLWLPLVAANAELWSRQHESSEDKPIEASETSDARDILSTKHADSRIGSMQSAAPRLWPQWKLSIVACTVALAAMFVPVPYSVRCDCELQPVIRRFVAAPFEGALERALVDVGDTVAEGQVLARMDGKEVRWEQAGNTADFERATKERDAHLAAQEFGEAQLAKLQMQRLLLTGQLLEHRSEHLEIRSPIDGVVVSGELKRVEGARLSMGQTLFEIAPLDQMIVEVEIPEAELANVLDHTRASVRLEAFPGQRFEGTLERICPRAELRRKQQVFVGELSLPNATGQLRPGMRGRVSLEAGHSTLAWRLFHRGITKFRLWWGA